MPAVPFDDKVCRDCRNPYWGRKNSRLCPACKQKRNVENNRAWKDAHREERIAYYRQRYRRERPVVQQQKDTFPWGRAPGLEWLDELTDRERTLPIQLQAMTDRKLEQAIEALVNA